MIKSILGMFKRRPEWEYGMIDGRRSRRNTKTGVCQFILWRAGQQGHMGDQWHDYGAGHSEKFILDK